MNPDDAKMLEELERQIGGFDTPDGYTDIEMTPRMLRRLIELARKGAESAALVVHDEFHHTPRCDTGGCRE